jgi:hypothetical protein
VIKFGQDVKNSIILFRQNNRTMKKAVVVEREKEVEEEKGKNIYTRVSQ